MGNKNQNRISILKTVQTPFGFFVLITLIIETIIGTIVLKTSTNTELIIYSMIIILLILIIIVAVFSVKFPEALKGKSQMKDINYPISANVFFPPNEMNRYKQLFNDFSGSFYAFNPPFKVENTGDLLYEEAIKSHEKRYLNNVRSRYLFFDKDSFERAQLFFEEIKRKNPKLKIDLKIKQLFCKNSEEKPGYTFFIGKKQDKACIILYPRAVMENGVPRAVIHIEGAEELEAILLDYFSKQWDKCKDSQNN